MPDLEKVIKGLEKCKRCECDDCTEKGASQAPWDCPVYDDFVENAIALLKEQPDIVRCKDCKHGSVYITEDVCGKPLIECNHPKLGDNIVIHAWDWFCADGKQR